MVAKHQARIGNWRLDSVGRLVPKYAANTDLIACWDAATASGIPPEESQPQGATNPRANPPTDGLFSEHVLRAFEAAFDRTNENDPFPRLGFKPNMRLIAHNLEIACRLAAEGYSVSAFTPELIPLRWLRGAAEFAYYCSVPGAKNALAEMDREMLAEGNRYPYLSVLWDAWGFAPKADDYVYEADAW